VRARLSLLYVFTVSMVFSVAFPNNVRLGLARQGVSVLVHSSLQRDLNWRSLPVGQLTATLLELEAAVHIVPLPTRARIISTSFYPFVVHTSRSVNKIPSRWSISCWIIRARAPSPSTVTSSPMTVWNSHRIHSGRRTIVGPS